MNNLQRFIDVQEKLYPVALAEIKKGRKQSHWMWYIFPQVKGLGLSETSNYYGINDIAEAGAFLQHPVLGQRLVEIAGSLLALPSDNAHDIFGSPDDVKLRSSMTLFGEVPGAPQVFQNILEKFFQGRKDEKTLKILQSEK